VGILRSLWPHRDVILPLALAVSYLIEVQLVESPVDDLPTVTGELGLRLSFLSGLLLIGSLLVRRRTPMLLLLPMTAWVVLSGSPLESWTAPFVALVVAAYTLGSKTRGNAAVVSGVWLAALIAAVIALHPDVANDIGDLVVAALTLAGPWLGGVTIRKREDREAALERRAAKLERIRAHETQAAVAEERARIARELHDIVAHAISVVVLQARGGRRALAADPSATRDALHAIEATGTEALADMRRLLGVYRTDGDRLELAPWPSLRHVDTLVAQVRDAGLPIELSVEGDPIDLPAGIDVSAYRILQEALTNALRHAGPATARVVVRYGTSSLDLEVADTGAGSRTLTEPGQGLAGMRERVALFGGSIDAGPRPEGGFVVRARLPVGESPWPSR
jgi:signal transduction histidine kinase